MRFLTKLFAPRQPDRPLPDAAPAPDLADGDALRVLFGAAPMGRVAEPNAITPPPEPPPISVPAVPPTHPDDPLFRGPDDLAVSALAVERALIIGSGFSEIVRQSLGHAFAGAQIDHILYNQGGALPPEPPRPPEAYAFQVIMLPLRSAMPEHLTFGLRVDDVAGHEAAFREARERLRPMLHGALGYRKQHQLITFVANFTLPQQNPMGRLLPRLDLRNPVYFIEQLNRVLVEEIAGLPQVYLLDVDQISANFGRRYVQDDVIWLVNHQSVLSDFDQPFDRDRIEPPASILTLQVNRVREFVLAICHELHAMMRTLRQVDQVKLVIVDLDDTLWRGAVAEDGIDRPAVTEGWPIGFVEALVCLRKRGVLLAIASKNDEARIHALWPHLYGGRLELSDFAMVRISFEPKVEAIEAILRDANLPPSSVVFVDDNPVERDHVATAFPGMRVLGSSPYAWRRILLWAPETQVAAMTGDSSQHIEMVPAQAAGEISRSRLSREDFLDTLDLRVRLFAVTDTEDSRFGRAFELLNKSNQFNTTGRRWTLPECQAAFSDDVVFWVFEVDDRFSRYGVVGVVVLDRTEIAQFVMSCLVVGLEVEIAVIRAILDEVGYPVTARMMPTDANVPCRDLYARCGFTEVAGVWRGPGSDGLVRPTHIRSLSRLARAMPVA